MARIGRPPAIEIPIDDLRSLTEAGWRLRQIAEKFGCSKQVVWWQMRKAGIPRQPQHSCPGAANPAWKGGRYLDDDGYVLIHAPDHPHATKDGRVREHRLAMEKKLGRLLLPTEVVHHIDGDRANNSPENLDVFSRNGLHLAATLAGKAPNWSEDGKRRIREAVSRPRGRRRQPNPDPTGSGALPSS